MPRAAPPHLKRRQPLGHAASSRRVQEDLQIMATVLEIAKASITAFNQKDWNRMKALYASDAVYDEKATNRRIQGPDQIIEGLKMWATAFPDAKGTIVREVAVG